MFVRSRHSSTCDEHPGNRKNKGRNRSASGNCPLRGNALTARRSPSRKKGNLCPVDRIAL
ncbi:MAG: hypothetical protein ACYCTV_07635 [Leptospirales bacterium]